MAKQDRRPTVFVPQGANVFVPAEFRVEVVGALGVIPSRSRVERPAGKDLNAGTAIWQGVPAAGVPIRLDERSMRRGRQVLDWRSAGTDQSGADLPYQFRRLTQRPYQGKAHRVKRSPLRWGGYQPGPWFEVDPDLDDGPGGPDAGLTVPPEILALAEQAAARWQMKVTGMTLAATKPEKGWGAIWRIETDHGPRSLKLLHRPFARNLFSIHAQEYLTRRKARVAPLVRTADGELYAIVEDRMFIVTDWIEGLHPASKVTPDGAAALCYGLGEFHRFSQGYEPPPQAHYASRLHRWPGVYRKMRTKIDWIEHLAAAYSQLPASRKLLEVLPRFRKQADDAIALLERSAYRSLVERGPQAWGLVHQDYGWSNGQLGPDGMVWIIDLDGVAFDLTFRDLRKLITGTMDDRGDWDLTWMRAMIDAYQEANPIEPAAMQVMLIDMLLPNEFYKLVKDALFEPEMLNGEMAMALDRLMVTDENKQRALAALGLERS